MTALSRRKGAQFERDVAKLFAEAMPGADIKRNFQYHEGKGGDVTCPVFHIECKRQKKANVRAALAQAERDCVKGKVPVAVVKDDRKDPFVVMDLGDFLEFVGEWWQRGVG